jgi:hypothetical protein
MVSSLFLTPLALCTMDSADWGTRTKEQQGPQPQVNGQKDDEQKEGEVALGNTNP